VAETLGILQSTISRWETGQYRITLDDMRILVRIYGVTVAEAGRATFAPDDQVDAS
jgi:transcriptional regulator with XRE-family HTH domain